MNADSPRPAIRLSLFAALLIVALLPATAPGQGSRFPEPLVLSEKVEKLRQQLMTPEGDPEAWQADLKKRAADVSGLVDLGKALTLSEWNRFQFIPGDGSSAKVREALGERFEKAVRDILGGKDATRQCAAVTLLAEMASPRMDPYRSPRDQSVLEMVAHLVPDVAKASTSDDPAIGQAAARALGRFVLEPEKAIPALGKLLRAKETAVRRAAAEALAWQARGHDLRPGEMGILTRPDSITLAACRVVLPAAAEGVKDEDKEVSHSCVEAIKAAARGVSLSMRNVGLAPFPTPVRPGPGKPGPVGGENAIGPAVEALGKSVAALVPLLASDRSAERRIEACQALEAIATTRVRMLRVAGGPAALAEALGGKDTLLAGLKEAVRGLVQCVGDKDVDVRLAGLYVLEDLGSQGGEPAASAAAKALKHDDSFVRWAAARVLGKMAPKEAKTAVTALAECVGDKNGDVRITVLAALERYGAAALPAVKPLRKVLKEGDEQTRLWAVRILAAIGDKGREETSALLIDALRAQEVAIRRIAVTALAQFGKPDEKTAKILIAALQDEDGEVRRVASEALLAEK
jgi:HEAT repeat protein